MSGTKKASRRDFLKTTAAVAGASLAGGLGIARSAQAAGTDLIRVALVGCGGRGQGAIQNRLNVGDNVKVVAVADAFEDNARSAVALLAKSEKYKQYADVRDDRIFWGVDAYQKAIDCGIDQVILATPPGFRPVHYRYAIEANKHVFMEKPCCVDAPGYRSLLETNKMADEKGLKVGVGLQRHHQASYLETVRRIKDGAIGKISFLRVYWNGAGVWVRDRAALAKLLGRTPTEMEYQVRNWYYFVWLSGDHICEQHIHNLDVGNWVMGAHPVEANGMGGRQVRKGPEVGHIFDHHSVEFTYADGTRMFSQCRHIPNCWASVTEHVHGTDGYSELDKALIEGKNAWQDRQRGADPYNQEHVDLVDAIRNNKPYNEGPMGADSSFTAVLGRMASYSGQVVKWDDAAANGPSEMPEQFAWDANPPVLPKDGSYQWAVAMPGVYKAY